MVAVQATRQRVVDLCHRCVVVSEVRAFYKAFDVSATRQSHSLESSQFRKLSGVIVSANVA